MAGLTMASGGQHGLQYVLETELGVTPPSPQMKTLRHTACSLVLTRNTLESNELRWDRQICDVRGGAKQTGGDISFELSYGSFDDFLSMALFNDWDGDNLIAGLTPKSATIERQFQDIHQYGVFTGCMVNTMSLSVSPQAMVTGTFGIIGLDANYSSTSLGGDLPDMDCGGNPPFDAFTGGLKEGGIEVAIVTSIELNLANGLEPFFAVGSDSAVAIPSGRCNITGTISAAFIDLTLLNKFINEQETSLEFTLGSPTGDEYKILLPRIKYTGANNPVTGETPISLELPFQALRSNTYKSNIVITRITDVPPPQPPREAISISGPAVFTALHDGTTDATTQGELNAMSDNYPSGFDQEPLEQAFLVAALTSDPVGLEYPIPADALLSILRTHATNPTYQTQLDTMLGDVTTLWPGTDVDVEATATVAFTTVATLTALHALTTDTTTQNQLTAMEASASTDFNETNVNAALVALAAKVTSDGLKYPLVLVDVLEALKDNTSNSTYQTELQTMITNAALLFTANTVTLTATEV